MLKSIILGLIQGLTEFLPVSSSGHLVLSQHFLNSANDNSMTFEVFLHLGSLLAVLIFFRKDIWQLIKSLIFFKKDQYKNDRKIVLWLMIGTFVTGAIGFAFSDQFESMFSDPLLVAMFLSITGLVIYLSDLIVDKSIQIHEMGWKRALIIGLGQSIAITPGISRSGTTIAFSLFTGLKRSQAARFSFLLSVPAILGANLKEFSNISALDHTQFMNYLGGFIAAFISGYFVIGILLKLIGAAKLKYFSYYCWAVSLVSVVLILMGF